MYNNFLDKNWLSRVILFLIHGFEIISDNNNLENNFKWKRLICEII